MEKSLNKVLNFPKRNEGNLNWQKKNVKKVLTNSENFKQSLRFPKKKGGQSKLAEKRQPPSARRENLLN